LTDIIATDAFAGTWQDSAPYAGDYALTIGNLPYGYIKSSLVAVTPGDEYDLTVYLRGQIDPEGSIGCWRVRATFLDASGSTLSVSDPASGCDGAGISEDWQMKRGWVVVPSRAVSLRVDLYNTLSTGWVTFDSPLLKRASVRKYYYAGSARIAMRVGSGSGTNGLKWLLSDHLGSVTASADKDGNLLATQRYTPWGSIRAGSAPTTFGYTGQRSEEELGLIYFKARWFDPALGRFTSADTMAPDPYNPADWDRYAYGRNSPLHWT